MKEQHVDLFRYRNRYRRAYEEPKRAGPTAEQWQTLLSDPDDRPFVAVILLTIGDEDALNAYGEVSLKKAAQLGAEFLYSGVVDQVFLGQDADSCDVVNVVRWPSRTAWVRLWSDPEYVAARPYFEAGLENIRILATTQMSDGG